MIPNMVFPNIFIFKNYKAQEITYNEAYGKGYKDILIICLKDGESFDGLDDEMMTYEAINKLTIVKSPLITVRSRELGILEVKTDVLSNYFPDNIDMTKDYVLVFPIFLLDESNIHLYSKQFSGISNIRDVLKVYAMNDLFPCNKDTIDHHVRLDMVKSMIESKFWMIPNNCGHNINLQFISRTFNVPDISGIKNENLKNIMLMNVDNAYVPDTKQNNKFIDPSMSIPQKGYRLYRITPQISLYNIDLMSFKCMLRNLLQINIKEAYYLINYVLVSKDYCHLVLHSMDIINNEKVNVMYLNTSLQKTCTEAFIMPMKYTLSYAWICMYMEECIKKTRTSIQDRYIFTADEASCLPSYPYKSSFLHTTPYLPIMLSIDNIRNNGVLGVNLMAHYTNNIGVANTKMFRNRLNIFLTGFDIQTIDVFSGLNWSGFGVTGSVMAACLPRYNPLIKIVDDNFNLFVNAYYPDADLDVMVSAKGSEFVDKVYHMRDTIEQNIQKIKPNANIMVTYKKTVTIVSNTTITEDDAYEKYIKYMEKYIENGDTYTKSDILQDEKYNALRHVVHKTEIKVLIRENNETPILFFNNIKFRLISEDLRVDMELFSIMMSPISVITRFYLPIVRAYYDGSQVYLTPSCISACMTLINIDYRYFAGTKDPIEVINRYRLRGFGVYLNDSEKKRLIKYSKESPKWKDRYHNINGIFNIYQDYINISSRFYTLNMVVNNNIDRYEKNYIDVFKEFSGMTYVIQNDKSAISSMGKTIPFESKVIENFDFTLLKQ